MFRRHRTTGDAAAKQPTGTPATTLLVPGAAITVLTEAGFHVGTGPADELSQDRLGGPVFDAAVALMIALIDVSQKSGSNARPPA
jgi:hypothetical protein